MFMWFAPRASKSASRPLRPENFWKMDFRTYAWVAGIVAGVTGLNAVLDQFVGFYALALTYLLAVVVLALFVGRGPVFFAATLSALLWNFFFLPPRFTFYITSFQDGMMFAMYFVVALVLGQLTARIRAQQTAERQREQRATALYLLTRELAESPDLAQLLAVVIQQVGKTFRADVALSLPDESRDRRRSQLISPARGRFPTRSKPSPRGRFNTGRRRGAARIICRRAKACICRSSRARARPAC